MLESTPLSLDNEGRIWGKQKDTVDIRAFEYAKPFGARIAEIFNISELTLLKDSIAQIVGYTKCDKTCLGEGYVDQSIWLFMSIQELTCSRNKMGFLVKNMLESIRFVDLEKDEQFMFFLHSNPSQKQCHPLKIRNKWQTYKISPWMLSRSRDALAAAAVAAWRVGSWGWAAGPSKILSVFAQYHNMLKSAHCLKLRMFSLECQFPKMIQVETSRGGTMKLISLANED